MPPESEGQPNFEETIEPVESSLGQSLVEEFEETPERELSPEEIEKVMEKVQDIKEYGTALTAVKRDINSEEVRGILKMVF